MAPTKRYIVTFFKKVMSDSGHEREIMQRSVEVFADSEEAALEEAARELCRAESLQHWSQHADRYEVEQPDFT